MSIPVAQQRSKGSTLPGPTRKLFGGNVISAASWDKAAVKSKPPIHAPLPIRIWHLASLDAPTVASVWCITFAWAIRIQLPWWVLVLVPLGVWAMYIADRLLDAQRGTRSLNLELLRDRHLFHWRHRRIFVPIAVVATGVAAWTAFAFMPRVVQEHDSMLAAASLIYFARVHTNRRHFPLFSKEFLVGLLFTLGCAIPAWSRMHAGGAAISFSFSTATAFFVLLAWLNCYAIDHWESADRRSSISMISLLLAGGAAVCSVLLLESQFRISAMLACVAFAALLFAALDQFRTRLTPVTLRAAADLALLTPAILLMLKPAFQK